MSYIYELELKVRDYECDLQGIVNNSVYQNYLEHTRHEFIKTLGVDFAEMHKKGIDLVVSRVEIDYKYPLRSGDTFVSKLNIRKQGKLRYIFEQEIYNQDGKLNIIGRVTSVATCKGKPVFCTEVDEKLSKTIK